MPALSGAVLSATQPRVRLPAVGDFARLAYRRSPDNGGPHTHAILRLRPALLLKSQGPRSASKRPVRPLPRSWQSRFGCGVPEISFFRECAPRFMKKSLHVMIARKGYIVPMVPTNQSWCWQWTRSRTHCSVEFGTNRMCCRPPSGGLRRSCWSFQASSRTTARPRWPISQRCRMPRSPALSGASDFKAMMKHGARVGRMNGRARRGRICRSRALDRP